MSLCVSLSLHSRCSNIQIRIQTPPPPPQPPLSIASVWPHSRRWRRRRRRQRTPRLLLPVALRRRQLRATRSPLSCAQPDSCSTSTSAARHTGVPARPPEPEPPLLAVGPPVAGAMAMATAVATAMTTATVMRLADCHRPHRSENAMNITITMSIERPPKSSRRKRPLPACRLLLFRARTRVRSQWPASAARS